MRRLALALAAAALSVCAPGCIGAADVGESTAGLSVCAAGPVTKGIDVSHYDGTIDWAAVHQSGVAWAFIKATENTTFVDPELATNWKQAGANGLLRGAYHFFRPEVDAVAQADFFVQTAGVPGAGDLPLTLDLEVTDNVAPATVASDALAFLARVQAKSGRTPIVYTSASFLASIGSPAGFAAYTLWVANWQVTCPKVPSPPWSDWTFWQNASTGTVPGISGSAVDTDQFNGTLDQLRQLAGASGGVDGGSVGGDDAGSGDDAGGDSVDAGSGTGGSGGDPGKGDAPPDGRPSAGGCSIGGAAGGTGLGSVALLAAFALALVLRRRAWTTRAPRRYAAASASAARPQRSAYAPHA